MQMYRMADVSIHVGTHTCTHTHTHTHTHTESFIDTCAIVTTHHTRYVQSAVYIKYVDKEYYFLLR